MADRDSSFVAFDRPGLERDKLSSTAPILLPPPIRGTSNLGQRISDGKVSHRPQPFQPLPNPRALLKALLNPQKQHLVPALVEVNDQPSSSLIASSTVSVAPTHMTHITVTNSTIQNIDVKNQGQTSSRSSIARHSTSVPDADPGPGSTSVPKPSTRAEPSAAILPTTTPSIPSDTYAISPTFISIHKVPTHPLPTTSTSDTIASSSSEPSGDVQLKETVTRLIDPQIKGLNPAQPRVPLSRIKHWSTTLAASTAPSLPSLSEPPLAPPVTASFSPHLPSSQHSAYQGTHAPYELPSKSSLPGEPSGSPHYFSTSSIKAQPITLHSSRGRGLTRPTPGATSNRTSSVTQQVTATYPPSITSSTTNATSSSLPSAPLDNVYGLGALPPTLATVFAAATTPHSPPGPSIFPDSSTLRSLSSFPHLDSVNHPSSSFHIPRPWTTSTVEAFTRENSSGGKSSASRQSSTRASQNHQTTEGRGKQGPRLSSRNVVHVQTISRGRTNGPSYTPLKDHSINKDTTQLPSVLNGLGVTQPLPPSEGDPLIPRSQNELMKVYGARGEGGEGGARGEEEDEGVTIDAKRGSVVEGVLEPQQSHESSLSGQPSSNMDADEASLTRSTISLNDQSTDARGEKNPEGQPIQEPFSLLTTTNSPAIASGGRQRAPSPSERDASTSEAIPVGRHHSKRITNASRRSPSPSPPPSLVPSPSSSRDNTILLPSNSGGLNVSSTGKVKSLGFSDTNPSPRDRSFDRLLSARRTISDAAGPSPAVSRVSSASPRRLTASPDVSASRNSSRPGHHELELRLATAELNVEKAERARQLCQEQYDILLKQHNELRTQYGEATEQLTLTRKEADEIKRRTEILVSQSSTMSAFVKMEADMQRMEATLTGSLSSQGSLEKQLAEQTEAYNALSKEHAELKSRHQQATERLHTLEATESERKLLDLLHSKSNINLPNATLDRTNMVGSRPGSAISLTGSTSSVGRPGSPGPTDPTQRMMELLALRDLSPEEALRKTQEMHVKEKAYMEASIQALTRDKSTLETQVASLAGEVGLLKRDLDMRRREVVMLSDDVTRYRLDAEALRVAHADCGNLEKEVSELRTKLVHTLNQLQQAQKKRSDTQRAAVNKRDEKIKQLRIELTEATKKIATLKDDLAKERTRRRLVELKGPTDDFLRTSQDVSSSSPSLQSPTPLTHISQSSSNPSLLPDPSPTSSSPTTSPSYPFPPSPLPFSLATTPPKPHAFASSTSPTFPSSSPPPPPQLSASVPDVTHPKAISARTIPDNLE